MATNTFDRKIVIKDEESLKRLAKIMSDKSKTKPISKSPDFDRERKRGEFLLKQCPLRSPR